MLACHTVRASRGAPTGGERAGRIDVPRLLDALHEVTGVKSLADFPASAVRALRRAVRADVFTYNDVDPIALRTVAIVDPPGAIPRPLATRWVELVPDFPELATYQQSGDGSARRATDHMSLAAFRRTRVYREVYHPIGAEYLIAFTLPAPAPHFILLGAMRRRADFDEHERATLNALRAHLVKLYAASEAHSHLLASVAACLETDAERAVALVDENDRWLVVGERVRTWLRKYADVDTARSARAGRLVAPRLLAWLERERAAAAGSGPAAELPGALSLEGGGGRLVVRRIASVPGTDVVLFDEQIAHDVPLRRLGLTQREAEVLRMVSAGRANREIAEAIGVTVATSRKHIENILGKLGLRNRTEAAALALKVLGRGVRS